MWSKLDDDCIVFVSELSVLPEACKNVKCGENAHCFGPPGSYEDSERQVNQTLCVCNDGFIGDPYDSSQGCQPSKSIFLWKNNLCRGCNLLNLW